MKGLIFIPDISGYTGFVKETELSIGVSIVSSLLNIIIDENPLDLEISEIEGDAVLYYKIGKPLSLKKILWGFKSIYEAFENRYKELKLQFGLKADLSLKVIVHYGDLSTYCVKGFKQLYGQAVVESHSLLKNGCEQESYILITNDYLKALGESSLPATFLSKFKHPSSDSHLPVNQRKIDYYFFYYNSLKPLKIEVENKPQVYS